jgi:hypothetical protein
VPAQELLSAPGMAQEVARRPGSDASALPEWIPPQLQGPLLHFGISTVYRLRQRREMNFIPEAVQPAQLAIVGQCYSLHWSRLQLTCRTAAPLLLGELIGATQQTGSK